MSFIPKNVLFVGHDANRAGAQVLLLRWLELLAKSAAYKILILLKTDGELRKDYEALGHVWIYDSPVEPESFRNKILQKLGIKRPTHQQKVLDQIKKHKPVLVVSNTLTNGDLLETLSQLNIPVISYVHELQMHLDIHTTPEALAKTLKHTHHYVVCANIAGKNLVQNHGILPQDITYLPTLAPTIDFEKITNESVVRRDLWLEKTDKVVGMIGGIEARKGTDWFIQLARQMPKYKFVWVGGKIEDFEKNLNVRELPQNFVHFPNTSNVYDYLQLFDVLALTSRMEVFPLVALEALMMAKPVVCFADAGGTFEIVGQDAGFCISDFDVSAMGEKVKFLLENPTIAQEMGCIGKQKVLERHESAAAMVVFESLLSRQYV